MTLYDKWTVFINSKINNRQNIRQKQLNMLYDSITKSK